MDKVIEFSMINVWDWVVQIIALVLLLTVLVGIPYLIFLTIKALRTYIKKNQVDKE